MRHKINFTISIETNDLDHETYMELQQPLYERIVDTEMQSMSFEEINEILKLDERKYYITGIEFPDRRGDENGYEINETKIEIKA